MATTSEAAGKANTKPTRLSDDYAIRIRAGAWPQDEFLILDRDGNNLSDGLQVEKLQINMEGRDWAKATMTVHAAETDVEILRDRFDVDVRWRHQEAANQLLATMFHYIHDVACGSFEGYDDAKERDRTMLLVLEKYMKENRVPVPKPVRDA